MMNYYKGNGVSYYKEKDVENMACHILNMTLFGNDVHLDVHNISIHFLWQDRLETQLLWQDKTGEYLVSFLEAKNMLIPIINEVVFNQN